MLSRKTPKPADKHVGARVRMRRLAIGLSQEKLAAAIGLTFQQVQKYEKGTNRIGASRLQQLANALKVAPAFFFEGMPNAGAPAVDTAASDATNEFLGSRSGAEIIAAWANLDTTARILIRDFIIGMAAYRNQLRHPGDK